MDDMDMAMALVAGLEDLDQVMLAMSPGSSTTSSAPAAAADLRRGPSLRQILTLETETFLL